MRRALVTADALGGVWRYALDLAGALRPHGWEARLAVLGPPPSPAQEAQALHRTGSAPLRLDAPLDWEAGEAEALARGQAAIRAAAEAVGADLLQVNQPAYAGGAWPVPVVAVAHSCVGTWWRAVRGEAPPEGWRWHAEAVRAGLEEADAALAPSHAFADALRAAYPGVGPVEAVANGTAIPGAAATAAAPRAFAGAAPDPHAGRPSRDGLASAGARCEAADERRPFVLAAGRFWDEAKGLAVLDAAAAQGLPWPVLALGATEGPGGERAAPSSLQALGRVEPEEAARLMEEAAMFASPALYEPFGLAALEAGARGAALVLSDLPTFREIWGEAALYVPPRDAAALHAALARLVRDEAERARLGSAARARASLYTLDRTAGRMAALYDRLLDARRVRGAA